MRCAMLRGCEQHRRPRALNVGKLTDGRDMPEKAMRIALAVHPHKPAIRPALTLLVSSRLSRYPHIYKDRPPPATTYLLLLPLLLVSRPRLCLASSRRSSGQTGEPFPSNILAWQARKTCGTDQKGQCPQLETTQVSGCGEVAVSVPPVPGTRSLGSIPGAGRFSLTRTICHPPALFEPRTYKTRSPQRTSLLKTSALLRPPVPSTILLRFCHGHS